MDIQKSSGLVTTNKLETLIAFGLVRQNGFRGIAGICLAVVFAVSFTLGACSVSSKDSVATNAKSDRVVRVAMIPFTGNVPLYLADEEQLCESHGIELNLIEVATQNALDTVMSRGEADIGVYANTSLVFAAAAGVPLRAILFANHSKGADGVVVSSDIRSIRDLANQQTRFAADVTDVGYFLFMAVAAREGLYPRDFNHVPLKGVHALSAFLAGKIDAIATSDPELHEALVRKDSHILFTSEIDPTMISDVFASRQSTITEMTDELVDFSRCWSDAVSRMFDDLDKAIPIMSKRLGIEESAMLELLPGINWPNIDIGKKYLLGDELRDSFQFANDFYVERGELTNDPVSPHALISDAVVLQLE